MQTPTWPEVIKALTDRGWKQAQLAERIGAAQSTVSDLGAGNIKDPRHSVARVLLAMLESGERPMPLSSSSAGASEGIPS